MTYPCGIIKDLLPLYIDGICSSESTQTVKAHLAECKSCRKYYEEMSETNGFIQNENNNLEDEKMADSLKTVKTKINKKIRKVILCAVSAVIVFVLSFNLLFNVPIKTVSLKDVSVSAEVYSIAELAKNSNNKTSDNESVYVYSSDEERMDAEKIHIPELGNVVIAKDTIEKCKYLTSVSVNSKYFLRNIKQETDGDTIYITAFKTTFFANKAKEYQKSVTNIEFKEINKIVFIGDGNETVLWEK